MARNSWMPPTSAASKLILIQRCSRFRHQHHHLIHRRQLLRLAQVSCRHLNREMLRWLFAGGRRPACVQEMRFQEPIVIYRHHTMDKEMADRKADARSAAVQNANSKKIDFVVSRDLLVFMNKAPRFFTFIPPSTGA